MWELPRSWSYRPYTQRTGAFGVSEKVPCRQVGEQRANAQAVYTSRVNVGSVASPPTTSMPSGTFALPLRLTIRTRVLGFASHGDDDFSLSASFSKIPERFRNLT